MRIAWLIVPALLLLGALPAGALDEARALLGVDRARTDFGVTGRGVVVGIIDRGIDATHPSFRTANGSSRILAVLDLTDDTGANADDNPWGVGTIHRKAAIDKALRLRTKPPIVDLEGRGTASAGIACGSGAGSKGARYGGVAPYAHMLVVRLKLDPPPEEVTKIAAGDERDITDKGKDVWFDLRRLRVAIHFCVAEAKQVGLPLVMLMNFGQIGGPTDGGSKLCRVIDETVGGETPGRVFVTGSSDKGDRKNRAKGRVTQGGSITLPIQKEAHGEVIVDIWYPGADRFDVSIKTPKDNAGPFKAPKTGKSEYGNWFQYYHLASSRNQVLTLGGKRQIRVDLIGQPGQYSVTLHGAKVTDGRFDALIGPNPENPMSEPFNKFLAHATPGSLWDGASAKSAIVAGCYILRTDWKSLAGRSLGQMGEGKKGAIWLGSGTGPTADGRPGVTLCAPGDRIVSAYAPGSDWAKARRNLISNDGALYGLSSGTTAAAALTAGVVALMLEANPKLTATQIKRILQDTARTDAHTGKVPNPVWGHGKLDAYAAIGRAAGAK